MSNMAIVRSEKVPKDIPDHNVWNDCWHDEKRNLYVTYCKYFQEIPNTRDRPHQIQYERETGDNEGIVIIPEDVEFRFGYPAVSQKDSKENPVWYLLPTMTDDMLTKEIVKARLRPASHEESVLYRTKSEQWITIGTKGLSICERENEISDELGLYPPVPIDELRTLFGKK